MKTEKNLYQRKPDWLKLPNSILSPHVAQLSKRLSQMGINTVCKEAACPNRAECWHHRSFTFIIMGRQCTRQCPFCNIENKKPQPVNINEPEQIARFVKEMNLKHIVITSVTRDDLTDAGTSCFLNTIKKIRQVNPSIPIELLIPDFGDFKYFDMIINKKTKIIGFNMETVENLYPLARPQYSYKRGLDILSYLKQNSENSLIKSSLMVGIGESKENIYTTIKDIKNTGCDIVYIGQYLAPSKKHLPVQKYYTPLEFKEIKIFADSLGFRKTVSAPLVRSSYKSWETIAT
ncbi:lipoyl synthase [bacterium]|nr:lipoyl synthase [bacterium]